MLHGYFYTVSSILRGEYSSIFSDIYQRKVFENQVLGKSFPRWQMQMAFPSRGNRWKASVFPDGFLISFWLSGRLEMYPPSSIRDKYTSIFLNNHWGKVIRKMVCGRGRVLRSFINSIYSRMFPCSFLLTGPRQWWAFWADLAPFIDTGRLVVTHVNYQKLGRSQIKSHLYLTTTGFSVVSADDVETARVNNGRLYSPKSPSLARASEGKEQGNRCDLLQAFQIQGKVLVTMEEYLPLLPILYCNIMPFVFILYTPT